MKFKNYFTAILLLSVFLPSFVFASNNISGYAWNSKIGWIYFGATNGNAMVSNASLSGEAWNDNVGWINLAPTKSGVKNDTFGNLSGSAFGENTGWIDFSGVKIDSLGNFSGTAVGQDIGNVYFSCKKCNVKTSWILGVQEVGGGSYMPASQSSSGPSTIVKISQEVKNIAQIVLPPPSEPKISYPPIAEAVPQEAPVSMSGKLSPIREKQLADIAILPLPDSVKSLAMKFPKFAETLEKVQIKKPSDVNRLQVAVLSFPGISEASGVSSSKTVALKNFTAQQKQAIPSDFVFARASGGTIDLGSKITFAKTGEPVQTISALQSKTVQLVVRPEKPAKSVTGQIILISADLSYQDSSVASLAVAGVSASVTQQKPSVKQNNVVVAEFKYLDSGNGVFTASVTAPAMTGKYRIKSTINYQQENLQPKELDTVLAVDPEGYIYEANSDGNQIRLKNVLVTIFWLNPDTKKYEIWPAGNYQQENPQTTDVTGRYAFLVPPGSYYLKVEKDGYKAFQGQPFQVTQGNDINDDIQVQKIGVWDKFKSWLKTLVTF